jgi:hypothetical protein
MTNAKGASCLYLREASSTHSYDAIMSYWRGLMQELEMARVLWLQRGECQQIDSFEMHLGWLAHV